jgi:trimeric autotransporter adhesin
MPSTYSPSLKLELIQSGEQPGVWGNTTNKNLGTLLEQAIAGTTSVDVTAGNVILTSLNGLPDEARSATLYVFGTPGVTRVITIPDAFKNYTVQNATANIVQIKTSVGTAFDCPPLSHSYINCNDSDVVVGRSITNGANTITSNAAPFNSPAFTGTPTAPTAAQGTNTTQLATTAFVNAEITADTANLAPLASPAFTGVPTAPTATPGTNTTQLATTAFVTAAAATRVSSVTGTAPVVSSGGTTPVISMAAATTSVNGYLTSTDWNTFNNKTSNTGTVTSVGASVPAFLSVSGSPVTTSGTLSISYSGTALPVANGGTGLTSIASGRVLYGSGGTFLNTSTSLTFVADTLTVDGVDVSSRQYSSQTTTNTAIGNNALKASGSDYGLCTAVGRNALAVNIGSSNTAVGYNSLDANTTGNDNTAVGVSSLGSNTTATGNTAVGVSALASQTTNGSSTAIGRSAMANANAGACVAIGDNALNNAFTTITGGHNVSIGYYNFRQLTTGANNIGFGSHLSPYSPVYIVTTESNRIVMGNTSITGAYIQVAWSVVSDARDKMNFGSVPHGLDFVKQLNPVSYQFKENRDIEVPHGPVRYGFKAQDILALEGDQSVIIDAEKPEKLLYNGEALVPVLVNAIKELSAQVEQMKAELAALKG